MPRQLRSDEAWYECKHCGKRIAQVRKATAVTHACRGPNGLDRPKTRSMKRVREE